MTTKQQQMQAKPNLSSYVDEDTIIGPYLSLSGICH